MSTFGMVRTKCFICKARNNFGEIRSTSSHGPSDLDARPSEPRRSTMPYWIQVCPSCGYVSSYVDDETTITRPFLESEQYIHCDGIAFVSTLASNFYQQHLIKLAEGDEDHAFTALLYASWACDDAKDQENAILVREKAILLADRLLEANEINDAETVSLIRADMMRRAGHFEEMIEQYKDVSYSTELSNQIIAFEIKLAEEKNAECKSVEEAENNSDHVL